MAVVISPSGSVAIPDGTPAEIRRALEVTPARFCRFTSDLTVTAHGEYAIEADIGPARHAVGACVGSPWYQVRLLIPPEFPNGVVHTVPLDPAPRGNRHQNGDWPLERDPQANVLCPPTLNEIYPEELLLPYIRHAHEWITAALTGRLTTADERYETPHLVDCADHPIVVYVEGGVGSFEWVRAAGFGIAQLCRVHTHPPNALELYRVAGLAATGRTGTPDSLLSTIRAGAFGAEQIAGYAPWVYAGSPVARAPHHAPHRWKDLPPETRRRMLQALRRVDHSDGAVPLLLLAFGIPKVWEGEKEAIVWAAVQLADWESGTFDPPKGFRPDHPEDWPKVRSFITANDPLRWIRACRDISPEALSSRSASTPNPLSGRRIAVLGAGALGSMLATTIAKLDPADLLLIDKELLEPGNLVRHEAAATGVESPKAVRMAEALQPLRAEQTVRGRYCDILKQWEELVPELAGCDLILDATGNVGVHTRLADDTRLAHARVAWCYVKPGPAFGFLALRRAHSTMSLSTAEDALRTALEPEVRARFDARQISDNGLVWPTPGCYHPTFDAPFHGMRLMADGMLTVILDWFGDDHSTDIATLFAQERHAGQYGLDQRILKQVRIEL